MALSIKLCLHSRAAGSAEDNFQSLPGFPQAVFKRASRGAQGGSDTPTSQRKKGTLSVTCGSPVKPWHLLLRARPASSSFLLLPEGCSPLHPLGTCCPSSLQSVGSGSQVDPHRLRGCGSCRKRCLCGQQTCTSLLVGPRLAERKQIVSGLCAFFSAENMAKEDASSRRGAFFFSFFTKFHHFLMHF